MDEEDVEQLVSANRRLVALLMRLTRASDESMGLDTILASMALHLLTQSDILRKWGEET